MRLSSKARGAEKRASAMSVLVATAAFVVLFLVGLWVLSGPTGSPGYSPGRGKMISVSEVAEDRVGRKTTYLPKYEEKLDTSLGSQSTDVVLADETLPDSETSEELATKSDKFKEDALTEFENFEAALPVTEQSEETETYLDNPVEDDRLDEFPAEVQEKETDLDDPVKDDRLGELPIEAQEKVTEPESNSSLDETPEETAAGDKAELSIEKEEASSSTLLTQGKESKEEKIQEVIQGAGTVEGKDIVDELDLKPSQEPETTEVKKTTLGGLERVEVADDGKYQWNLCTFNGAQDYIPCLDNKKAIKELKSTKHYEHRERHCPVGNGLPTCLVPLPEGYKIRVDWPQSRDQIWHANVPHDKLVTYKQDQNWVKNQGAYLMFPGGGTQFKKGALQYIDTIHKTWPDITWGKHVRTVLDVGCGVASFGGYMFEKDALVMSFAPKDEHEAQVQMALERGIPGILSVMGTKRLVFPSNVFDVIHCARCRVPWHGDAPCMFHWYLSLSYPQQSITFNSYNLGTWNGVNVPNDKGGKLLLELNRLLRPGGYFVWSATPVYRLKDPEDVEIWKATTKVTDAICWNLLVRTKASASTGIGMAIFQKPVNNTCYEKRTVDEPPMCPVDDKADAAWYVDMNSCIHRIPTGDGVRATSWPANWPARLETTPKWLSSVPKGVFGKPASEEFVSDTTHWQNIVTESYFKSLGIEWEQVRNVLDMKAGYGGFAVALSTQPVWVINVVPTDEPDTLPIIYDRGLLGLYHDWCESFSTYPRTYDLLHANRVFASVEKRCSILTTVIEMDRILRPNGWAIFRDKEETVDEIEEIIKSLRWTVKYSYVEGSQRLLAAQKGMWRPNALV